MQNRHATILNKVNRKDKKLSVLSFPTHDPYFSGLAKTGHDFYMFRSKGLIPGWNSKHRPMPSNVVQLSGNPNEEWQKNLYQIKQDMRFDIILSQNKFGQFEIAKNLSNQFGVPLISLEHTLPMVTWTDKYIDVCKSMKGDINVFISEYSCKKWGWNSDDPTVRIVHHGIDTDLFKPNDKLFKNDKVLTVVNDFIGRGPILGFDIYRKVTQGLPTLPIGDSPNFSKAAKNIDELLEFYKNSSVFLNTSVVSPVPTSLLEAMSVGMPVVSTSNCMIPEVIEDGVNGFCTNDESVMRERLVWCLENPKEAREIGLKGRQTILDRFGIQKHINNWNKIFDEAYGLI